MTIFLPTSIFDAECPSCGGALAVLTTSAPADGLVLRCSRCGFVGERVGGLLIERDRTSAA